MEETTLIKFFKGQATSAEQAEVKEWLEKPESREEFDKILEKHLENPALRMYDNTDYNLLLDGIHRKIKIPKVNVQKPILPLVYKSLRIAASIILCVFLGYVMVQSINHRNDLNKSEELLAVSITVRSTGPGEKLTLLMSDQTKIIVNAESEISFSSDYGLKDRIIKVDGEAFFEVASDPTKPFKVITNTITTTALGTEFNVYTRDSDFRVALVEGKVAVTKADESIELTPGLMAELDLNITSDQTFIVQEFDSERTTAWKQGNLTFDRKPLKDILADLEKWYGVRIKVDEGIDLNSRLIGSYNNKNLKDILTGLGFTLGFEFVINEKNVQLISQKL